MAIRVSAFRQKSARNRIHRVLLEIPNQDNCKMVVYGNGNIPLKQYAPPPDMPNVPTVVSGSTEGNPNTYYQFSAFAGDPYAHAVQYRFDWGDGTPYTTTYPRPDGTPGTASHSWSSGGFYGVRVQARCAYSDWGSWSNPIYINIGGQTAQLTVYAYNQYGYPGYVPLYIDGNYVTLTGNTTLNQLPNGNHNITVYATDRFGNTAASETIHFTIKTPESTPKPSPTIPAAACATAVVVITAGLLVYFKRHRR